MKARTFNEPVFIFPSSPFNDVRNVSLPAGSSPTAGCCSLPPPPTEFIDVDEVIDAVAEAVDGAIGETAGVDEDVEVKLPVKACKRMGMRASGDRSTPITEDISRLA